MLEKLNKNIKIFDTKKTLANYLDISMDNLFSILSLNLNTIPGQTSKTTMNFNKKDISMPTALINSFKDLNKTIANIDGSQKHLH